MIKIYILFNFISNLNITKNNTDLYILKFSTLKTSFFSIQIYFYIRTLSVYRLVHLYFQNHSVSKINIIYMYFLSTVTSPSALNEYELLAKYEFRAARHSSKRKRVHKKYIYYKIYLSLEYSP